MKKEKCCAQHNVKCFFRCCQKKALATRKEPNTVLAIKNHVIKKYSI